MATQPFTVEQLKQLVSQAQEGDTEAFGRMYDGFLTPVYRYVVFRFPADMAEDLVADIFMKAWEKLHTYKVHKDVPFSAWLFRIARHTVIDAYRSQRGFDEITEEIVDEESCNDPKARMEQRLQIVAVRKALARLPRFYREILLLHYVAQLSHSEVARSLHMTEGAVRVLKCRALKKLEGFLQHHRDAALLQPSVEIDIQPS